MKDINLLPEELKPKSYAIKLSKNLRRYSFLGLIIFVIALMVMGGIQIALTIRQRSLDNKKNTLESQIKALEATEQKLVLVKDRLGKIEKILSTDETSTSVDAFSLFANNLPEGVSIESVSIDKKSAIVSLKTDSSQNLSRLFGVISSIGYKKVILTSFSYNIDTGYKFDVSIVN